MSPIARCTHLLALATAMILGIPSLQGSSAASSGYPIVPDPGLYCYENSPLQMQVEVNGWIVQSLGAQGDVAKNNWRCVYNVAMAVPVPVGGYGDEGYTLPPFRHSAPIDWAKMCQQQFPGSKLEWWHVPGPVQPLGPFQGGLWGPPWKCVVPN